jgi:hypothetical protein
MSQAIATSGIVSQAFRYMEMAPVSSLADDSEEALAASEQYPVALRMCLEQADWSFASILRDLPETVPASGGAAMSDPGLPHVYALPSDLVVLRQVGDAHDVGLQWRVDRAFLRANRSGPLLIRYTGTIQNESLLPALFRDAVALQLAVLLMRRWVPTHTKHQGLREQLRDQILQALHADARSASAQSHDPLHNPGDWLREATR